MTHIHQVFSAIKIDEHSSKTLKKVMAVLFFSAALAVFFIVPPAAHAFSFALKEDGFLFPVSSLHFPNQFLNISFIGNKNLTLEKGNHEFNAFFAIPLNESNLAHEIHIIPNNASAYSQYSVYQHTQRLYVFSKSRNSFYWTNWNGTANVHVIATPCYSHMSGSHDDNIKIQFYTNGTATFKSTIMHTCNLPILYNFTHGNYFYIPFIIFWQHIFQSFTLEMGNGINLAFYEGQYENPPKEKEWPLLLLPTTTSTTTKIPSTTSSSTPTTSATTTKIPTTSFPYSEKEFEFSIFVKQNYDLLIIIAILCFLILFCSMAAIFLCCFLKSK